MITVTLIPILKDNYAYLLEADTGDIAVLDPGEAGPIIDLLSEKNLKPDYIFNTHHHGDHTAGNAALLKHYDSKLAGPKADAHRIPNMEILLSESDSFRFGTENVQILETPGHTTGGICFYFPDSGCAFTGDCLFLMSCGRIFEGTSEQMWDSLSKIAALPDETLIYCGHEYTVSNAEFCLHVEPDNDLIKNRYEEVKSLRAQGLPTIPAPLSLEKQTNVFLRAGSAENFAVLRKQKDDF